MTDDRHDENEKGLKTASIELYYQMDRGPVRLRARMAQKRTVYGHTYVPVPVPVVILALSTFILHLHFEHLFLS